MSAAMATVVMPQPAKNRILMRTPQRVQRTFAAGNGINEARSATLFGDTDVSVLGFVGADDARSFKRVQTQTSGITVDLISVPGVTRMDRISVWANGREHHTRGHSTYAPNDSDVRSLQDRVRRLPSETWISLTGALALGMDPLFYAYETRDLHELGIKVVLDVRPYEMQLALKYQPDVITPNLDELTGLIGRTPDLRDRALMALAKELLPNGLAIFKLGREGVFARAADGRAWRFKCDPKWLKIVHRVGCGDALVGWLTAALMREYDIPVAVAHGVAAATANLTTIVPGYFPADLAFALVPQVDVVPVIIRSRQRRTRVSA